MEQTHLRCTVCVWGGVGTLGAGRGGEGAGIRGVACSEGFTSVAFMSLLDTVCTCTTAEGLMASNCEPGLNELIKV